MKLKDVRFITDQVTDRLVERLRARLGQTLGEKSPALVEELKTVLRHPRELAVLLEGKSPWLSRKLLGAASNLSEPFLAGTGLAVERIDEESVEVRLPGWWRNQGDAGTIHSAALMALGELASRLYWEHHLDLRSSELSVRRAELRVLPGVRGVSGDVRGVYRMQTKDREAVLLQLRSESVASVEAEVSVYDNQGRMVAQIEVEWRLERHLTLGPGRDGDKT